VSGHFSEAKNDLTPIVFGSISALPAASFAAGPPSNLVERGVGTPNVLARSGRKVAMAAKKKPKLQAKDLQGFKYFKVLTPLLERLHDNGTAREEIKGDRHLYRK
jgi:hypothetical protein